MSWALALALFAAAEMPAQVALPDSPGFTLGLLPESSAGYSTSSPSQPLAPPIPSPIPDPPIEGVMAVRANPCSIPASPRLPDPSDSAAAPPASPRNPCPQQQNQIQPFVNGEKHVTPLTVGQKGHLAFRDVTDPFNLLTIAGNSAYTVATYSHSPYGPGMRGFGRLSGYTFLQDATGETIGTFALSSAFHEDPRYFREPHANPVRRVFHAVSRVVIAQSDSGRTIPNYANLIGSPICAEISNLYVPGIATNSRATTDRILYGFLNEPVGTLIAEFLPDFASHIHVRIVIVQRYLNQISGTPANNPVPGQVPPPL